MRAFHKIIILVSLCVIFFACHKDNDVTPPQPPTASAGSDQTIPMPASSFTLSGSGTTRQGAITDYAWIQVSGPNNAVVNSSSSSATTSVSGFAAGTYVFRLAVTNDAKLSATDEVTVTVIAESATAPVADAGSDQTIQLSAGFFVLSGSGATQNGTITDYLWSLISGPNTPVINNATSATTSVSGFTAGTYTLQLQVTNSAGLSDKDTVVVVVNSGAQTLTFQPSNNSDERHILGNANTGLDQSTIMQQSSMLAAWTTKWRGNIYQRPF